MATVDNFDYSKIKIVPMQLKYATKDGTFNTAIHADEVQTQHKKRLIVCCDGTWFAADKGDMNLPSNVARIGRLIAKEGIGMTDIDGEEPRMVHVPQIVYYQSGVGTGSLTWVDKRMQGQ